VLAVEVLRPLRDGAPLGALVHHPQPLAQLRRLEVQLVAPLQPLQAAGQQPVIGRAAADEALDVDALEVGARAPPQKVLVDAWAHTAEGER